MNDIDDETPAASDNDDDSDTTIDCEQAAQFAVNDISYPPHRQRWCHVVRMANLEYWCRQHSRARCLFWRELGNSLARSHAVERLDSSQWQIAENRIMRPSHWSDLLITDSGSSLPLPTTKNSGDGPCDGAYNTLYRASHVRKTTRTCHNRCVSVCKQHSGVPMTCLHCAEGPGPSTVAALSAEAPNDSDTCYRELRRTILCRTVPLILRYITYCVPNFNALDTSTNVSHPSVPNGVTMNLCAK